MKKEDNKRKKKSVITSMIMKKDSQENMRKIERKLCVAIFFFDSNEKEQLRKYEKKGKQVMCDKFGDDNKKEVRKIGKKRKMDKHLHTLDERSSIFNNVQTCDITDPCILTTPVLRLSFRKVLLTFV